MNVAVGTVFVDVVAPVVVGALGNANDAVVVIEAVNEHGNLRTVAADIAGGLH